MPFNRVSLRTPHVNAAHPRWTLDLANLGQQAFERSNQASGPLMLPNPQFNIRKTVGFDRMAG